MSSVTSTVLRAGACPIWRSNCNTRLSGLVAGWLTDGRDRDGLLTAWPVDRNGAPLGPPRPLSADLARSPTWSGDSSQILYRTDAGMKMVDVGGRRVVREIAPRLTWTPASPQYVVSGLGRAERTKTVYAGRFWDSGTDTLQRDWRLSSTATESRALKSIAPGAPAP
jgi:hypothetical protein